MPDKEHTKSASETATAIHAAECAFTPVHMATSAAIPNTTGESAVPRPMVADNRKRERAASATPGSNPATSRKPITRSAVTGTAHSTAAIVATQMRKRRFRVG